MLVQNETTILNVTFLALGTVLISGCLATGTSSGSNDAAPIVLRTADRGREWSDVACLSGAASLVEVVSPDSLRVITQLRVAGNYPAFWVSDDGGSTWHERPLTTP